MIAPFVAQLRTRPGGTTLGSSTEAVLHLRVEMPEVWDTVRINASPAEPVLAVKVHALARLYPNALSHDAFVMKLAGREVLDENAALADAGAKDGSIFLLTHRRRRPIRRAGHWR